MGIFISSYNNHYIFTGNMISKKTIVISHDLQAVLSIRIDRMSMEHIKIRLMLMVNVQGIARLF